MYIYVYYNIICIIYINNRTWTGTIDIDVTTPETLGKAGLRLRPLKLPCQSPGFHLEVNKSLSGRTAGRSGRTAHGQW